MSKTVTFPNGSSVEQYTNRQGNAVEIIREANGSIKSVEVSGTGSHRAFQAQLRAARKRANAATVITNVEHAVASSTPAMAFCTCNQGFSGARAAERLVEHIANPNPNSLGALLAQVMV